MRIQVSVRNPDRDLRAAKVPEFNPVRLHVRTDSIFLSVAVFVPGTSLSVFVAVSVPVSMSVQLEGISTNYNSRHR